MAHMYWALCCPTPGCERFERVAYIGDVSPHSRFTLPQSAEGQYEATCPQCDKTHTYKAASFVPIQRDQPPEEAFANWF
jgi:hypothetical protein